MSKLTPGNLETDQRMIGRRDAFHAPAVLVRSYGYVRPGDRVRFTSPDLNEVEKVDGEESTWHAIMDPFLPEDSWAKGLLFWVLLRPGVAQQLVHSFDIKLPPDNPLEAELKRQRADDPGCAECWHIEDGRIVRD